MHFSLVLGTFFGIPVKVHWTFIFVFVWAYYVGTQLGIVGWDILWLELMFLLLFFCVLLHEFGHALTARRYGVRTIDIILTPIGGIARLERLPKRPWHEFLVAIAGPAVNIVIALLLLPIVLTLGFPTDQDLENTATLFDNRGNLIALVFLSNIVLAVFNLIPAFPMDGGRILRALLSMNMERLKATRIAVVLGYIMAALFVYWGVMNGDYTLSLIGLFVYFTGTAELKSVRTTTLLEHVAVGSLMRQHNVFVDVNASLSEAWEKIEQSKPRYIVVMNVFKECKGFISTEALKKAMETQPHETSIRNLASPIPSDIIIPETHTMVLSILPQMVSRKLDKLPVRENYQVVGVLELQDIQSYMAEQNAAKFRWPNWLPG